ncbi:MAG TPA: hypothetical protein VJ860_02495 [Polyangia bacterium]|nr:hypothetical protein [Polyangia bacterium]
MLTALLLGAGASRELGMPLREELNAEIVAWLTPTSLRKINSAWRTRGFGHPDEVIDDLSRRLESPDFDYEALLAEWEAQYIEGAGDARGPSYHSLYAWLAQVVSLALYRRQVSHRSVFQDGLPYFAGLVPLARDNAPLWVFSVNHDVLVECLAAHFGIPVSCGFPARTISLPCRRGPGTIVAALRADVLCEEELADAALPFFPPGTPGINLLKLRGALDVFALGDSQNLLKLKPEAQSFDAIIDALQIANEGLLDAGLSPDPLSVTNQIPFIDQNSERQVLRRTLLASATRLTDPYPQLMQRRFLEYFRANLGQVDLLVAIGCSMSDAEVNEVIQDWLESSTFRRLEIVAPRIQQVPAGLEPVASQITLTPASTTTYLEQFG